MLVKGGWAGAGDVSCRNAVLVKTVHGKAVAHRDKGGGAHMVEDARGCGVTIHDSSV